MRGIRLLFALLLVGVVAGDYVSGSETSSASGVSSTAPPTDPTVASDELIRSTLDVGRPGCSAAVGIEGQVVWRGVRGLADIVAQRPITPETVFDAASVTKQFTAAAVLLLAQDGRLAITDPVGTHVTGLPAWGQQITLKELIQHTSGLPDLFGLMSDAGVTPDRLFTQADALQLIAAVPEPAPQRGDFVYSNTGYVLLAEVVRVISGMPLPEFLQQRIFGPLDLSMSWGSHIAVPGRATSYYRDSAAPGGYTAFTPAQFGVVGPSGIQTTPAELVRWGGNYRTGAVGGRPLLDAQTADPVPAGRNHYSAGLIIDHHGDIGHDGNWEGFLTEFLVSADRRVAVAVMCNAQIPRSLSTTLLELWA
jgi:CubicO group peptidase (beta-lactamase class C family)